MGTVGGGGDERSPHGTHWHGRGNCHSGRARWSACRDQYDHYTYQFECKSWEHELGDDPASMATAGGQVGSATVAGMSAAGGGRKRRNAAPGGGTKRRAIGNVVSPQPAIPDVLDQCVATTTIMGMPLPVLVAGTAAAAIAKKNGQGPYVQMVPTATHGTFRLLTPATGAPSPPRMQLPPYPNTVNSNVIVDPPARIPIAHTQYHPPSAPTPAPGTSHPQGIP